MLNQHIKCSKYSIVVRTLTALCFAVILGVLFSCTVRAATENNELGGSTNDVVSESWFQSSISHSTPIHGDEGDESDTDNTEDGADSSSVQIEMSPGETIFDNAGVLSNRTVQAIHDANIDSLRQLDGFQLVVVTLEDLQQDVNVVGEQLLSHWQEINNVDDCMLLLVNARQEMGWFVRSEGVASSFSLLMTQDYMNLYFWPYVEMQRYDAAVYELSSKLFDWRIAAVENMHGSAEESIEEAQNAVSDTDNSTKQSREKTMNDTLYTHRSIAVIIAVGTSIVVMILMAAVAIMVTRKQRRQES